MSDRTAGRSSEDIRRDLEGTRSDLHNTVDALERKLSVGQAVDEVLDRMKGGSAGDVASSVGDTVRDHPVPLALMGLGLAWMAVDKVTGSSEKAKNVASGAAASAQRKTSDVAGAAKRGAAKGAHGIADLGDQAGDAARQAGRKAARTGRKAARGVERMMNEQPLAVGAMAFGLGLASGLSVPTTRWEDETMGGAADEVKKEARSATRSAKDAVKATASAAKDEADRQNVSGQLKESARQVASRAKEEAKEQVREKDLDSDGIKDRASEAGQRARERAGD